MKTKALRVLITGGGNGLGAVIARRFAKEGSRVAVTDIEPDRLQWIGREDEKSLGIQADAGDQAAVSKAIEQIAESFGGLDVLVNNAGIPGPRHPLENIDPGEWDRVMAVNLSGAFYAMRAVIPHMKAQGAGCIVNISTTSVRTGLPNRAAYVASKAGLQGLTYSAARELGPFGIRSNAVLPGYMDNPRGRALITRHAEENGIPETEAREKFLRFISMRSMIDMEEVAAMVAFLASEAGRHVSGQFIGVCGNQEYEI